MTFCIPSSCFLCDGNFRVTLQPAIGLIQRLLLICSLDQRNDLLVSQKWLITENCSKKKKR